MKHKIVPQSANAYRDGAYLFVACSDAQGRQYRHEMSFSNPEAAHNLAVRVAKAGKIDLSYWDCIVPYGSEAWLIDGMEVTLMDDAELSAKGLW